MYFLYIKVLDTKNGPNISWRVWKCNVICLKNKNGNLWVIMKYVKDGLSVKKMSDLVLKEIYGVYGKI